MKVGFTWGLAFYNCYGETLDMDNHHQIPAEQIRKELALILDFDEIKNSQVLSKFIEFVVERKLAGHEDEIKEYTIAVKALGKPRDYNPQLDATVRIHAGRLRRSLAQYYQASGLNDEVIIDIPKGSYVPVFTSRAPINGQHNLVPNGSPVKTQLLKPEERNNIHPAKKPVLAILPFQNLIMCLQAAFVLYRKWWKWISS